MRAQMVPMRFADAFTDRENGFPLTGSSAAAEIDEHLIEFPNPAVERPALEER